MSQVEVIKRVSKPVVITQPKRTVEVESGANMAPHALRNHTDVEVANLSEGQVLKFLNDKWRNVDGGQDVQKYTAKHDFNDPYDFLGKALLGSPESSSVWSITRLTIDNSGAVTATQKAENVNWSNRYSHTYN